MCWCVALADVSVAKGCVVIDVILSTVALRKYSTVMMSVYDLTFLCVTLCVYVCVSVASADVSVAKSCVTVVINVILSTIASRKYSE